MKKKPLSDPIVSPEILEMAKRSVTGDKGGAAKACVVCGATCSPLTGPAVEEDDLCWVCRRLKISAWRDSDQQASAQE